MDILTAAAQPFHELYFTHFQGMADNPIIWIFIWALLFDIITGFAKSLVSHKTTSTKGTDGLIKHSVILFCILTLYPLLDVNGFKTVGDALTTFYTLFYVISILENWGQMGLPFPSWAKQYIYKLGDDYQSKNTIKKGDDKHND